ncbi:hypothetical protein EDC96DRAFT_439185, partial [Choanephora cucurbitarum]
LEETNLANFGSELERQHRKEEGELEKAWNYEGSPIGHETGMWVWRVNCFNLEPVPTNQYGKFYQGDSYVVLKTTTKQNSEGLIHNIHFWLVLDGYASQHREVQHKESALFSSYFRHITYLQGGYASGFHHVEEEQVVTRLLRVHRPKQLEGSRTRNAVVISEVPLSHESLRSTSQNSGSGERQFYEALGSEGDVADEEETEEEEEEQLSNKRLLRLSASGPFGLGHLKYEVVAEGTISKDMFDTHDVYIFDVGHQIYTWIGRKASRKERKHGLEYAQKYVKECEGRSPYTPICQVVEDGEDELFESNLEGWQGW